MTRWSIAPSDSIAQIGERERGWGQKREGARERNTKRIEMPANILRQTLRGDSCTLTATPSFANICRSPSTPETRAISRSATTSTLASCHTPCPRSLCVISHARTRCVSCARALSSMVRVRALHQAKETAASSAHVVTHKTGQHAQGKTCTHFSAYRMHADDPLIFHNGFTETWRNGDPSGCVMRHEDDGRLDSEARSLGTPGLNASSLSLVYEWPEPSQSYA